MKDKPIKARPALYAYYFQILKEKAKEMGYNLIIHGSLNRDLDLVAIPWINEPMPELELIKELDKILTGKCVDAKEKYLYSKLPGGRNSYVISMNRGGEWNGYKDEQYYLDISITPCVPLMNSHE